MPILCNPFFKGNATCGELLEKKDGFWSRALCSSPDKIDKKLLEAPESLTIFKELVSDVFKTRLHSKAANSKPVVRNGVVELTTGQRLCFYKKIYNRVDEEIVKVEFTKKKVSTKGKRLLDEKCRSLKQDQKTLEEVFDQNPVYHTRLNDSVWLDNWKKEIESYVEYQLQYPKSISDESRRIHVDLQEIIGNKDQVMLDNSFRWYYPVQHPNTGDFAIYWNELSFDPFSEGAKEGDSTFGKRWKKGMRVVPVHAGIMNQDGMIESIWQKNGRVVAHRLFSLPENLGQKVTFLRAITEADMKSIAACFLQAKWKERHEDFSLTRNTPLKAIEN